MEVVIRLVFAISMAGLVSSPPDTCQMTHFGYTGLIATASGYLVYINSKFDNFGPENIKFDVVASRILLSSMVADLQKEPIRINVVSTNNEKALFWLDENRLFSDGDFMGKTAISIPDGIGQVLDIDEEASRIYGLPKSAKFLGRCGNLIFWRANQHVYLKNINSNELEMLLLPKFVERVAGVMRVDEGHVAIFGSGENPRVFHGHPGWGGFLVFDLAQRKIVYHN